MAKKSMMVKQKRTPKFKVRGYNRCPICGRPHGYMRRFHMCRICLRKAVSDGIIPGVTKASW